MASRQPTAADAQPAGNAEQARDKEFTTVEGFMESLRSDEVTLYVHREDLGKHGYLAPPLKFNPAQHNIGHLYELLLKRWGPGSYWMRMQSPTGAGFGKGSFTLHVGDPTPITPAPIPVPVVAPAPVAVAVPVAPSQAGGDVNTVLLALVRELMQRTNGGQIDMGSFTQALQGALTSQQQSIQAVTQRLDPNNQSLVMVRELLKLSRELSGAQGGGEVAPAAGGGMSELMMLFMMMQGGGGGGQGGGMQNMLPMMMMMQQQPGQQQNPMQMMQMMQMMQQQQQRPPQQQRPLAPQPDPWQPFPGPWGPTPPAQPRTIADVERELAELRAREAALITARATTVPPPASTPAPAPANTPPSMLQLDGYGGTLVGGPFDLLAQQFNLTPEDIAEGMSQMTPEEQAAIGTLMR